MTFNVFIAVFERGNAEDDEEWQDYETRRYGGEDREELEDGDCSEETERD